MRLENSKNLLRHREQVVVEAQQSYPDAQTPSNPCPNLSTTEEIDRYSHQATGRITSGCEEQVKAVEDKGHKAISDWAKETLETYGETLATVRNGSVLGGGITFVAIVSANRGNISYMCYSFGLFMLGLATSISISVPLTLYCRGPNTPIRNPRIWEGIIAIYTMGGGASVVLAFILLGVCVQTMDRNPMIPLSETFPPAGPGTRQDTSLIT